MKLTTEAEVELEASPGGWEVLVNGKEQEEARASP